MEIVLNDNLLFFAQNLKRVRFVSKCGRTIPIIEFKRRVAKCKRNWKLEQYTYHFVMVYMGDF
jgi:hypothetical protein